jgi:hypothetical protein
VPNTSYSTYGSGYFDGTGDYLSGTNNSGNFGTGDFTIELWIYKNTTGTQRIIGGVNSGTEAFQFYIFTDSELSFYDGNTVISSPTAVPSLRAYAWNHIAVTRGSSTLRLYCNGVLVTSAANTRNIVSDTVRIGAGGAGISDTVNGYITDTRLLKGTALYTGSTYTVPTAPLTAIANTSLLTLQNNQSVNNNVFLDNSTNNSFITRAGNATQGTFSPYGVNWSNYFTNNILSCGNASLIAGTNTFTIEFWVYLNSINSGGGNNQTFIDTRSSNGVDSTAWLVGVTNSTNLKWFTGTSDTNLGGTLPYRQWVHVAYTRNASNVITAYINGVATGTTTTDSRNLTNTNFWIGGNVSNTYPLDGYFSNVRWVVGTVVYTGNFTPSTTPLTAISNTKLLTCQSNRFTDNSGNNISISLTGSPTIQRFSPFNPSAEYSTSTIGGSAYFDGTTSNIITTNTVTTLGTQDFCMEAWVYCVSTTNYACIIGNDAAGPSQGCFIEMGTTRGIYLGGPEVSLGSARYNQWFHVVFCRVSGTYAGFVNGTRQATGAFSFNLSTAMKIGINNYVVASSSGYGTTGYISDGRVTVGSSPYSPSSTTITVPTAPLTAVQNTVFLANMTSGGAYDAAMMNNMQTVGDAKLSTAVAKFGGSSMAFDGTGDWLQTISSPQFDFGLGDFTLECWAYCNNFSSDYRFIAKVANISSYGSWQVIVDNSGYPRFYASSAATSWDVCSNLGGGVAISTSTWAHIAVTRLGTTFTIWVNGVSAGTTTSSASLYYSASVPVTVGGMPDGTRSLSGYIDDPRITKGIARYTTTFTPPTQAFPTY